MPPPEAGAAAAAPGATPMTTANCGAHDELDFKLVFGEDGAPVPPPPPPPPPGSRPAGGSGPGPGCPSVRPSVRPVGCNSPPGACGPLLRGAPGVRSLKGFAGPKRRLEVVGVRCKGNVGPREVWVLPPPPPWLPFQVLAVGTSTSKKSKPHSGFFLHVSCNSTASAPGSGPPDSTRAGVLRPPTPS